MRWRRASTSREAVLKTFGFKEFKVELSTWDPKEAKNYAATRNTGSWRPSR